GPVRAVLRGDLHAFALGRRGLRGIAGGPGRAHLDPAGDVVDDRGRQLLLRRHLEVGVDVPDRLEEEALLRVAGDDRRAGVAALEDLLAAVEPEGALQLLRLGAVALVAALDEKGSDLFLEEFEGL